MRQLTPQVFLWLASAILLGFLLIPLAAIFIRAIPSGALGDALSDPVIRDKHFGYVMGIAIGVIGVLGCLKFHGVV